MKSISTSFACPLEDLTKAPDLMQVVSSRVGKVPVEVSGKRGIDIYR